MRNYFFPPSKEGGALRAPLFYSDPSPLAPPAPPALQRPSPPSPLCVHAAPEVRSAGSRTVVFFCKISRKMYLFYHSLLRLDRGRMARVVFFDVFWSKIGAKGRDLGKLHMYL